jgi:opacity protein-like surface antigen
MKAHKLLIFAGAALAFAAPQTASAVATPNAKLWSGTWHLNLAKSKFSAPDYSEKAETRTYTVSGNRITMKSTSTGPSGKQTSWSYSAAWDGKPYSTTGNSNADHIALTPVSDREVKSRTILKGKDSAHSTASVSADGKEITMDRSILTANGGPSNDHLVFDRAK